MSAHPYIISLQADTMLNHHDGGKITLTFENDPTTEEETRVEIKVKNDISGDRVILNIAQLKEILAFTERADKAHQTLKGN